MAYTDADLALARRHVAEGKFRIQRQRALVARLRNRGLPTRDAEELLGLFEATLSEMILHRNAISVQLYGNPQEE